MLRKGIPSFTDCLVGDDCCHLILTSISVTAQSDNIHGEEEEGSLSSTETGLHTFIQTPSLRTSVGFLLITDHVIASNDFVIQSFFQLNIF